MPGRVLRSGPRPHHGCAMNRRRRYQDMAPSPAPFPVALRTAMLGMLYAGMPGSGSPLEWPAAVTRFRPQAISLGEEPEIMALSPDYRSYSGVSGSAATQAVVDAGLRAYMLRV